MFIVAKRCEKSIFVGCTIPDSKTSGGQADSVGPNLYALGCSFPSNSDRDPEA